MKNLGVVISAYNYMQNRFKGISKKDFQEIQSYEPSYEDIDKTKSVMISPYNYILLKN